MKLKKSLAALLAATIAVSPAEAVPVKSYRPKVLSLPIIIADTMPYNNTVPSNMIT